MNKLVGYDCPLKRYPSPAVPIVRNFFGKYKAVYLNDDLQLDTEPVVATAKFYRLSDCDINLQKKLESFDYRKHRLFAISKNCVEFYDIIDEVYFFIKLLIDKDFSKNDPFTRVLVAEVTGINKVLCKELQMYEQYLWKHQQDLLPFWNEDKKELLEKIQGNEGISSQLNKIPVTGEKASEVEVNYTNLRNLLRDKKEDEADKETEKLIKKLNEKVIKEEIKCFPVIDLHTIDKLWLISSSGESGLSIKKMRGEREDIRPRLEGCGSDLIKAVIRDLDYARLAVAGSQTAKKQTRWDWSMLLSFAVMSCIVVSLSYGFVMGRVRIEYEVKGGCEDLDKSGRKECGNLEWLRDYELSVSAVGTIAGLVQLMVEMERNRRIGRRKERAEEEE